MYIILRALAAVAGGAAAQSWVPVTPPGVPAFGYPNEDAYVALVAEDFRRRGVTPATVHLMDWDFASHLSTRWQEWLLMPRDMAQARYASAGEPRVAAFGPVPAGGAGGAAAHRHAVGIRFSDFYHWACVEQQAAAHP